LFTVSIYVFVTNASYTRLRSSRAPSACIKGGRTVEEHRNMKTEDGGRDQRRRGRPEAEEQRCRRRTEGGGVAVALTLS
jgi:hypothetical protein